MNSNTKWYDSPEISPPLFPFPWKWVIVPFKGVKEWYCPPPRRTNDGLRRSRSHHWFLAGIYESKLLHTDKTVIHNGISLTQKLITFSYKILILDKLLEFCYQIRMIIIYCFVGDYLKTKVHIFYLFKSSTKILNYALLNNNYLSTGSCKNIS